MAVKIHKNDILYNKYENKSIIFLEFFIFIFCVGNIIVHVTFLTW